MNIIIITIDCLRQDRCGIYDYYRATTPTIDSIADEAYIFDNAYSTGPTTTESFAGILAGRLSKETEPGDTVYRKTIPNGEGTIASHLQDYGYSTGAIISNPRVDKQLNIDKGFDTFLNLRNDSTSSESTQGAASLVPDFHIGNKLYEIRENMRDRETVRLRYLLPFLVYRSYQLSTDWPSMRSQTVITEFLNTIEKLSEPFFAWTHLMDLHGPINPGVINDSKLYSSHTLAQFYSQSKRVGNIHNPATSARYDAALRHIDDQVYRIQQWLKRRDLFDNTAIIITADHGEALADRGIYGHPLHYMYDELLQVPLIIRIPGQDGTRIQHNFSLGWLHELISDMLNISRPKFPSQSSRETHLSSNAAVDSTPIYADTISEAGHTVAIRQGNTKMVRHSETFQTGEDSKITKKDRVTPDAMFRLDTDPNERNPLDVDLDHHLAEKAENFLCDPDAWFQHDSHSAVDKETLDQLQQLGYSK